MSECTILFIKVKNISNNSSLGQQHPCIRDSSDNAYGITYPLMERSAQPVPQRMGFVACLPTLLLVQDVVMYTRHQNDTCVTLFAGAPVVL